VYVLKPNINAQTFLSLDIDCAQLGALWGEFIGAYCAVSTILEAGRKFRFEIKTMKTQLLAGIICQLLVVSTEYLLFPVVSKLVYRLFPAASKIQVICPQLQ